ncbi:hypothetical protein O3P69_003040 [Scylla paramamosain]|uniref:Ig-like domain-containing protein n=1 Tax=Scylla paramamosain TaxID=85552 RepID=A0AAW0UK98_SCYPA
MAGRVGCRSSLLLLLLLLHVTVNVRQAGGEQQPHFLHQQRALNMSVQRGSTAYLHCRVADLQDQSVSWYRKRGDEIQLITFDFQTYHNDDRFALSYEQPHNWRLRIRYVQERDEGSYRCQVGTHPPLALTVRLQVVEAAVHILDERGVMLREKFYRVGSTIELQCRVADVPTATTLQLAWYRNRHRLNYDDVRGGVSVKTELRGSLARSWLRVGNAIRQDSGSYSCNVTGLAAASVTVHVVPDEYPAAIQRGVRSADQWRGVPLLLASLAFTLIHTLPHALSCCILAHR